MLAAKGKVVAEVRRPVFTLVHVTEERISTKIFMFFIPILSIFRVERCIQAEAAGTRFCGADQLPAVLYEVSLIHMTIANFFVSHLAQLAVHELH